MTKRNVHDLTTLAITEIYFIWNITGLLSLDIGQDSFDIIAINGKREPTSTNHYFLFIWEQ